MCLRTAKHSPIEVHKSPWQHNKDMPLRAKLELKELLLKRMHHACRPIVLLVNEYSFWTLHHFTFYDAQLITNSLIINSLIISSLIINSYANDL